jgi:KaiC/GvpD/RAD55 family RecA-like ATPase
MPMIFRLIPAKWNETLPNGKKRLPREGEYTFEELLKYNEQGYNCYYFPNHPGDYSKVPMAENGKRRRSLTGADIDTFEYCFVDLDMKDYQNPALDRRHNYATKQEFIDTLTAWELKPSAIVDTGGGIHAYWRIDNLDAMSFLRLNRRLCRKFSTDPAVSTLNQLMRVPGTNNVKIKGEPRPCELLHSDDAAIYDVERVAKLLPPVTPEDETAAQNHYDKAYNFDASEANVSEELPQAFVRLCRLNGEAKELFYGTPKDRSAADFRLAHLMFGNGISKDDARSVLFNTAKASERTRVHRFNYANNIVDKIWVKGKAEASKPNELLPRSVKEIDADTDDEGNRAERFYCHPMIDATDYGFRLTHVLGLIGGSGNGKTTVAMNMAAWFAERNKNKDYINLYVTLEMREEEISEIWKPLSQRLKREYPGVDWDASFYILGNYDKDGTFRELGFDEIREFVFKLEKATGKKVGCVVLDHIGILKQEKGNGTFDGLIGNCRRMKAFAVATNTFLIVQSQTSRGKNGGGDMELDMDAAFGTSNFEFYADWIMTVWQPLKRIVDRAAHMLVVAFKFPKIRKKHVKKDLLKADTVYGMMFDPDDGSLHEMTTDQHTAFDYWNKQATAIRNRDKKREPAPLRATTWTKKEDNGKSDTAA